MVATSLQVSCSQPLPSSRYHIPTHSELSHVSFSSTRIFPQIMIHLGIVWMNRIPRGMSLVQNLLLPGFFLWHNQSILKPQCSFCIFTKTSDIWVTISHSSLDMPRVFISLSYAAMISLLKVGVRVMLNNDKSGNTWVLDSSPVEHTTGK
jgi:hypothetical protein